MLWLQRHSTAVLYGTYALSVMLMIFCIITFYYYAAIDLNRPEGSNTHPHYVKEFSLMFCVFFGTANAMIIFRMFTLNLITLIIHTVVHLIVAVCLILHLVLFVRMQPVKSFYHTYSIQVYIMLAVYLLQCLAALHLIVFKPGKTELEREKRSGLHAFFGVVTFVVLFWNIALMISMLCINPKHARGADDQLSYDELLYEPSFLIVFIAIYMLLILFILLTPFFRADAREISAATDDDINESDFADYNEQLIQTKYLYVKEGEEKEVKGKGKFTPRQDLMILAVSQTSIGRRRRRHRAPQDSRVEQMKSRLEEVWQADRVVSQTSLEESSCRSQSPPASKCPPLKRLAKIRKRAPQCPTNKEPEPQCSCSKPCQSPSRCRSHSERSATTAPQKHVSRSCSPKGSSTPSKRHDENNWHHLKYDQLSLTSFEERNMYGTSPYRADTRDSRLKTALTSQMQFGADERCSCSKTKPVDNTDMPYGIYSTSSEINLAMERPKCSKTAQSTKKEDLSACSNRAPTLKRCMACGKCLTTVKTVKPDDRCKCAEVTSKTSLPKCKTQEVPPMKSMKKVSPTRKYPPYLENENMKRGRYLSAGFRTNVPKRTLSGSDIQFATAPFAQDKPAASHCEKYSTFSQTDFDGYTKSVEAQTGPNGAELSQSRLPTAPSSSFNYTDKPVVSKKVPTTLKKQTAMKSKPNTGAAVGQKRTLSAPAKLYPLTEKPKQEKVTKSTNTQPTAIVSAASQTDITCLEKETEVKETVVKQTSKEHWKSVPGLHGLHELNRPERSSSLRTSSESTLVSLRNKVINKPLPEDRVKTAETKRKEFRSLSKDSKGSSQNVSVAKTTPPSTPTKLSRQPPSKDQDSTKLNNIEKASPPEKTTIDSSKEPGSSKIPASSKTPESSKAPDSSKTPENSMMPVPIAPAALNAVVANQTEQNEAIEDTSTAHLTRGTSVPRVSIAIPGGMHMEKDTRRASYVDFNLSKISLMADLSESSKNSHGSSSSIESGDSFKDTR